MNSDNFMWFPEKDGQSAEGETTDGFFVHKKASEIETFSLSMNNEGAVDSTVPRGSVAGRVKFNVLEVNKRLDSASAAIYKACSMGVPFANVMLAVRKAGGNGLIYLQYIFRLAYVTDILWSGDAPGQTVKEKVKFSYKAMGIQYFPQKPDGNPGKRQSWAWNIVRQEKNGKGDMSLEIEKVDPPAEFLLPLP